MTTPEGTREPQPRMAVLVYSDDRATREAVRLAIGRRPAPDLPMVEIVEAATQPVVQRLLDAGGIDVAVLDGEAVPAGGMGMSRALKNEIFQCPPILVLIGRVQDLWLATWSLADAAVPHPIDPAALAQALARLMRQRLSQVALRT